MLKPTAAPADLARLRTRLASAYVAYVPHRRLSRWHAGVFCAAFVVLLAAALRIVGATSPTGDEPAYLLQAYGLWHFHSPDLAPAVRDPAIYSQLYSVQPTSLARDFVGNGERVLVFLPGYAALISPLFALGGRPLIAVAQALVATLVAMLLYEEALRLYASRGGALFAVLAYLLALPVLVFTGEAFPTTFALGLVFIGYTLIVRVLPHAQGRRLLLGALALGLIAFALPWLHTKYALIAIVLPLAGLFALLYSRRGKLDRPTWYALGLLIALPLLSFLLVALYSRHFFGTWLPQYNPSGDAPFTPPDISRAPRLYNQIFFDAQIGLVPWAPVSILTPIGFVLLFRRVPRRALLILACVLSLYAPFLVVIVAQYVNEAYALPGRFTVESMPFLALCVAGVFAAGAPELKRAVARVVAFRHHLIHLLARPSWRWSPVRLLQVTSAIACLAALGFGGWLASVAQLDPALLYPSHAGPRLTYEFPHLVPAGWFGRFPESEAPLIYTGAPPLNAYYSHGIPITDTAGNQGYMAARAPGKDGDVIAETAPLALPPGTYEAAMFVTCDPARDGRATFEAVALRNPIFQDVPVGSRTFTGAVCRAGAARVPLRFRFTSDGYRPIGLAVRSETAVTLGVWSVTFGPAPGTGAGTGGAA